MMCVAPYPVRNSSSNAGLSNLCLCLILVAAVLPCPASELGGTQRSDESWRGGFNPTGIYDTVYDAVIYEGELIVAGAINEVEGEGIDYLARHDGETWHSLDPIFDGTPTCLTVWDGKLVVGGYMSAGCNGVAAWDGESFSDLDGEVEFVTIMTFDSLEAVRVFAGEDYEAAFVPDEARKLLSHFDERSRHYELRAERDADD